jgi:actin-like protein 6A
LAKNAVLATFAAAKSTALVLDVGAHGSVATVVHDGYLLQKSLLRSSLGGDRLTADLLGLLDSRKIEVQPRYSFSRKEVAPGRLQTTPLPPLPNTTASYRDFCVKVPALARIWFLTRAPRLSPTT